MICTDKRLRLCTALLVCNLIFIWGNSLLPAEISAAISGWLKDLLNWVTHGDDQGLTGDGLLRKLAHFTEFTALGTLLTWNCGMRRKGNVLPFILGAAAACIDETIQIFVPGRGPGILDVCIDSCGVLTGMILLNLGHTYFRKRKYLSLEDTK